MINGHMLEALQDWEDLVQRGHAALASLSRELATLRAPDPGDANTAPALERAMQQAPSFKLGAYLALRRSPKDAGSDPLQPQRLATAYSELQEVATALQGIARQAAAFAEQHARLALAEPPAAAAGSDGGGLVEAAAGMGPPGLWARGAAHDGDVGCGAGGDAAQALPQQPPEEAALLALVVAQGLVRDAEWMARVAAAVGLDTAAEELETYMTLWGMQPFTDSEALQALRASHEVEGPAGPPAAVAAPAEHVV